VWLEAALEVVRRERYDLVLPTQEQVTVLSWAAAAGRLDGITTVVPAFAALCAVQDKLSAHATLERLGLPQPASSVLRTLDDLATWDRFPVFVKTPIGTATSGVRRLGGPTDLAALLAEPTVVAALGENGEGLLAQAGADGPLAMLQAVFDRGRLVAFHANLRVREGARGGASHKRSVVLPDAEAAIDALGHGLGWHGALSADAIITADGPVLIDINPRLVEPVNAWRSGVDLVGAMIDVATDQAPARQPVGRPDVHTHQLVLALLGAAQHDGSRRAIAHELWAAARHAGPYSRSTEELTPVRGDWRAGIPTAAAAIATLVRPAAWHWFSSGSVANYAITPDGWRTLVAANRPDRTVR
jgi:biotin carboxylase